SVIQLLAVVAMLAVAARGRARTEQSLARTRAGARAPRPSDWPLLAAATAVVAFILLPVLTLVWRSVRDGGGFTLDHYRLLADPESSPALRVSLLVRVSRSLRRAGGAAMLAMVLGLCGSIVVSRRPRGAGARRLVSALDGAFMLPLGISAVIVGFGF